MYSEEDRCILQERSGLPKKRILPADGFSDQLRQNGFHRRVDVILSISGDEDISDALRCPHPDGQVVYLKRMYKPLSNGPSLLELDSNITLTIVDPISLTRDCFSCLQKPLQDIIDRTAVKVENFPKLISHNVSRTAEAMNHLKELDQQTRIVLCMNPDDVIPVSSKEAKQ